MTTTLTDIRNDGTIPEVVELLKKHPLARRFEFADMTAEQAFITSQYIAVNQGFTTDKGKCYQASDEQPFEGMTVFSGNFFTWSFCFQIATNDAELIKQLTALICENIQRPDYLSQDKPTIEMGKHYILFPDGRELVWDNGQYMEAR